MGWDAAGTNGPWAPGPCEGRQKLLQGVKSRQRPGGNTPWDLISAADAAHLAPREMSGWERGWCCSAGDVSGCGRVMDTVMSHWVPTVGAPYRVSSCGDAPAHAGRSIVFHHPEPCCGQESLPQERHGAMRVLTHPSRCYDASTSQPCKTPPKGWGAAAGL